MLHNMRLCNSQSTHPSFPKPIPSNHFPSQLNNNFFSRSSLSQTLSSFPHLRPASRVGQSSPKKSPRLNKQHQRFQLNYHINHIKTTILPPKSPGKIKTSTSFRAPQDLSLVQTLQFQENLQHRPEPRSSCLNGNGKEMCAINMYGWLV